MTEQTIPRPEHPRPQLVRGSWLNLNGPWQFELETAAPQVRVRIPLAHEGIRLVPESLRLDGRRPDRPAPSASSP